MEHETSPAIYGGLSPRDRERVQRALEGALSANTRRAYLGHWEAFRAWAAARGYEIAPPLPETVAAHLADISEAVSISTLRVRRAAIGAVLRTAGLDDPTRSELVKRALGGLRRQSPATPRQAAPLTGVCLAAIRATAHHRRANRRGYRESERRAKLRGLVDIALCSVMRDALLRRSEAAALLWGDVAIGGDGSGRLTIRRSKTDPEGGGAVQYLGKQAVADLRAIRPADANPDDAVFAISAAQISRRIAAAARAAGLKGRFSGHSPRVGMAQDLVASGAALPALMHAGRWKSSAMPTLYTRSQAAASGAVAKYYAHKPEGTPP